MQLALFTRRSVVVATGGGIVVAAAFAFLAGDLWELALPAGLAVGALSLVTPLQLRDGRFSAQGGGSKRILEILACQVVFLLGFVTATALGLDRSTGWLLGILIVLAGSAAYSLGFIAGALHQIEDGDEAAGYVALHLRR